MRKIYWWFFVVCLSLRWIPEFNLGDRVWFRGKQWLLFQGVHKPTWTLIRGCKDEQAHADESQFTKVRSLSNYFHSFQFGYHFYMTSWFGIWVNDGIKPWMRECSIWAKPSVK